jgi:hypothetical protein
MKANNTAFVISMLVFSTVLAASGYAQECNIEMHGLNVPQNNHVIAFVKNLGDLTTSVSYRVFINGDLKHSGSATIAEDENLDIVYDYDFSEPGTYYIKVDATASCGAYTEQALTRYIFEDTYCTDPLFCEDGAISCDCDREIIYVCEDEEWLPLAKGKNQYCEYCCGVCGTCDCPEGPIDSGSCFEHQCFEHHCDCEGDHGVLIKGFTYSTNVMEGQEAYVTAEVRNTGDFGDWFSMKLYVDGDYEAVKTFSLVSGQTAKKTIYFYPEKGSHDIELRVISGCASDKASARINVIEQGQSVVIPQPEKETTPTSIEIGSDNLDIPIHQTRSVVIKIHSEKPQRFRFRLENMNEDWVDYEQSVYVDGDETVSLYITPHEEGHYKMNIYVTALKESLHFRRDVYFYVVPGGEEAEEPADFGDFSEFLLIIFTSPMMIIIMTLGLLYFVLRVGDRCLQWDFTVDKTEKTGKV